MAKGKCTNYRLISKESGAECGYIRMKKENYDKSKVYRKFDKVSRSRVDCFAKEIKKGGTKALANR